jgi:hypothetical protein
MTPDSNMGKTPASKTRADLSSELPAKLSPVPLVLTSIAPSGQYTRRGADSEDIIIKYVIDRFNGGLLKGTKITDSLGKEVGIILI